MKIVQPWSTPVTLNYTALMVNKKFVPAAAVVIATVDDVAKGASHNKWLLQPGVGNLLAEPELRK